MKSIPFLSLPFLLFASAADAQSPHVIRSHQQGPDSGIYSAAAGDLNQDGYSDYIRNTDGTANAYSGLDGSVIRTYNATPDFNGFARVGKIVCLGDVTGDHIPDFAWSNPYFDTAAMNDVGLVEVVSGVNGRILWQGLGPADGANWGYSLSNAGDINGDGKDDLMIGSGTAPGSGQVIIYSGANGSVIADHLGTDMSDGRFGHAASGVGDVNLDGFDDYIIGAYTDSANGSNAGMARVYSGADQSMIYEYLGAVADDRYGIDVTGGMDADGDGTPDFAVLADYGSIHGNLEAIYMYSGATGALLWQVDQSGFLHTAGSPQFVGDVNGDGYDDLAACAGPWSQVNIHSGLDGSVLYLLTDPASNMNYLPAYLGDVDGDGMDDFSLGGKDGNNYTFIKVYGSGLTDRTLDLQCTDPFVGGSAVPSVCYGSVSGQIVSLFVGFGHGRHFDATHGTYDLINPVLAAQDATNLNGTAWFNTFIQPQYIGWAIYLQAGDALGNRSNVVYRVVQ